MSQYSEKLCLNRKVVFETECIPEPVVTLTDKGVNALKEFSVLWGDVELTDYLHRKPDVEKTHVHCRHSYVNEQRFEQEQRYADGSCVEVVQPKC